MNELFDPERVTRQFNQAASRYDGVAIMQREAGDRMLERLDFVKLKPKTIIDVGAGTGYCAKKLRERYPEASVTAVDLAQSMLETIPEPISTICASAENLPLPDDSVDLVVSNMMIHWCLDVQKAIDEMHRVLKPGGLLLFTTLGPDSLHEMRESWATVDDFNHVHHFYDMHDLGDALLRTGLHDPVMDAHNLLLNYRDPKTLLTDLKTLGASNVAEPRSPGLMGKNKLKKFFDAYEKFKQGDAYPATYELIFAQGWGKEMHDGGVPGEFSVAVEDILGR